MIRNGQIDKKQTKKYESQWEAKKFSMLSDEK